MYQVNVVDRTYEVAERGNTQVPGNCNKEQYYNLLYFIHSYYYYYYFLIQMNIGPTCSFSVPLISNNRYKP